MKPVCLHNKDEIETFLRRQTPLNLYALGDLDEFTWPYTTWYGLQEAGRLAELVLLYSGGELPTLLGVAIEKERMRELLRALLPLLPAQFHAHLDSEVAPALEPVYRLQSYGPHHKMVLSHVEKLRQVETDGVEQLGPGDLKQVEALYAASYPGNWFDARMLETGYYYGLRRAGMLVCIAGIHVFSEHYRIATLGNVTTHPKHRGRGLATAVCARLCIALAERVEQIGLNVKANNRSAIACYQRLGFTVAATYEEYYCARRP